LVSLLVLLIAQSFLSPEERLQRLLINAMFFGVVLAAIRSLSRSRARMWTALGVGTAAYVLTWAAEAAAPTATMAAAHACFLGVFALLIYTLSESLFAAGPVDDQRLVAAISVYLCLALVWAFLYALIESFYPGSFDWGSAGSAGSAAAGSDLHTSVGNFIYFSAVTLTTLGYGDVLPTSPPARMMAGLQAMLGQVYLAVVVARLVGLHLAQR
jgi:voltage-gated potassium channel Kch